MTESSRTAVRRLLIERYDEIKRRLTQRLGSSDLASEALQDAWVKIAQAKTLHSIRSPRNYVLSVAMNAARDRMKDPNNRYLTQVEIDGLLEVPDEAPSPAQIVENRSELQRLEAILAGLPKRQREILLAARVDKLPRQEIARRLGISLRLVEKELQRAVEHCLAQWEEQQK